MMWRRSALAALSAALCIVAASGGCVGAVAGIPVHPAVNGAKARNALLPALIQARGSASYLLPDGLVLSLGDRILLVDASGTLTLVAGTGRELPTKDAPILGTTAALKGPLIASNYSSSILMSDLRGIILSLNLQNGFVALVAGDVAAGPGWSPDGALASSGRISAPSCLEAALNGDIYYCEVAPGGATVVRAIRASGPNAGRLETVAGDGSSGYAQDGALARSSGFAFIADAFFDERDQSLLIAELGPWVLTFYISNSQITRVSRDGVISVIAGNVSSPWRDWFVSGTPALSASLNFVTTVCASGDGTVYFAEFPRVVRVSNGVLTVLAGRASNPVVSYTWALFVDGAPASTSSLGDVYRMRPDNATGSLIISDVIAGVVYRLYPASGAMQTMAGRTIAAPVVPGASVLATQAGFPSPNDVDVDGKTGDVYGTLSPSNVVVRLSAKDGLLSVVAGTGQLGCGPAFVTDATTASLADPYCAVLDGTGGLIICDYSNCLLRRVDLSTGSMRVIAGDVGTRCVAATSVEAHAPYPAVPEGTVEQPSAFIGSANYATVSPSGDVYWTVLYPARVMVLRNASGRVYRIAGNGVDTLGAPPVGGRTALNIPLHRPYTIK